MILRSRILLLIVTVLNIWQITETYPSGAPESVCETMLPFHGGGIPPMSSPSPFRVEPSTSVVGQGEQLTVEIFGTPSALTFGGFMLQARNTEPPYQVVGQFAPHALGLSKHMNCNGPQTSITHSSSSPKPGITLEWQAPVDFLGRIIFNATIAQQYDKFWVGVPSNEVNVVRREAVPPPGISTTRTPLTSTVPIFVPELSPKVAEIDPFYDGCGLDKTCFGFPDGCIPSRNCRSISAVSVKGDRYQFEIKSGYNQPAYVALGLSEDDKMGDDSVMECIPENGRIALHLSWTTPRPNLGTTRDGVPQNIARLISSSYVNGTIYCKIERDPNSSMKGKNFDLISNKYYLLLAAGGSLKERGVGYHNLGRLQSGKALNLAVVESIAGASTLLLRLHGAFMIAAWIGTTSVGIILARYFKQTWVGNQLCGKDQWFAWHRICMVTTWSLTMAAFVIIFVEIGTWSSERNPHAILGVVTTVICFLQPIGALFRPAPNAKNRPIFNWVHWLGGNLAHILAIVTIFFAVKLTKAELPDWMDWILVAFVAFHVLVHLIFSISGCVSDRRSAQRVNSFPMGDMTGDRNNSGWKVDRKQDASFAGIRKSLLAVYIVIAILFVVAFIVIIVLAPIEESVQNIKAKIMDKS